MRPKYLDDEKVKEIGQQIGSRHLQEFLMLWFKKITIDSFFDGLTLFCRYGGIAKHDMDTTDGREYVVAMHHDLGRKWSIFMQYILEEGMKRTLNIIPKSISLSLRLFLDLLVHDDPFIPRN